jgi:methionyl-tRNA formyltransferase
VQKSGRIYLDEFCDNNCIPLLKSNHINNLEVIEGIRAAGIDWLFIVGWSQVASMEVLNTPRKGVLGMHPTLLPEGRGRAAIPWAILKGLDKTGVSLFKLDDGVDSGPVIAQVEIPLTRDINATKLYSLIEMAHVQLIREAVPSILCSEVSMKPQDESKATVWPGRRPEDGQLNLDGSVHEADRLIRAVTRPYPGAFFYREGIKYIVWSASIVADKLPTDDRRSFIYFKDGRLLIEDADIQVHHPSA